MTLGHTLAVSGLAIEARIAAGPGVRSVVGGVDASRLATALEHEVATGASAILSFGIAGGLAPGVAAGAWIVGRGIVTRAGYRRCDEAWTQRLCARLPGARLADLAGCDAPIADAAAKRALHAATAAMAVDTESHVAAEIACVHGLPFAAFRVIADDATRGLPAAACVALAPGGRVDMRAVLRSLAQTPSQLPLLVRTAVDARAAFASLRRGRLRLGGDLRALDLDVP